MIIYKIAAQYQESQNKLLKKKERNPLIFKCDREYPLSSVHNASHKFVVKYSSGAHEKRRAKARKMVKTIEVRKRARIQQAKRAQRKRRGNERERAQRRRRRPWQKARGEIGRKSAAPRR